MKKHTLIKLEDYKKYPFLVPLIELDFEINDIDVLIKNKMWLKKVDKNVEELILKGKDLNLESIFIDSKDLERSRYHIEGEELIIKGPFKKDFTIETICRIDPYKNTTLEGLYESDGLLTTQCEAEGFRRITYHPDRPDVLSRYRVKVKADRRKYPKILSNGNEIKLIEQNIDKSKIITLWEDPHPKPSYLFALVACNLDEVNRKYKTNSGKEVLLRMHVETKNTKYTKHALDSLEKAMRWDEKVYDLEYDLNQYNIVAVRHFNMGAMENKSLNIFNSKLVLADTTTATDDEFERIESVIAHEYFHNWTGNRITCRDWFQLSLKEGLTVFRDQSFTEDMHSRGVKRIEDAKVLRNHQFIEDSGPTSHAVKPNKYKSIDNFYTTTIYEKGAELIRMIKTMIGEEKYIKGFKNYIDLFDGQAATTEDFLNAVLDGAYTDMNESIQFDRKKFNLWYYKSGTPIVDVKHEWDSSNGLLRIYFYQNKNIGKTKDETYIIPIKIGIFTDDGKFCKDKLFILDKDEQTIEVSGLPKNNRAPYISLFRDFSAPVKWSSSFTLFDSLKLFELDDNPFARWDAGQRVFKEILLKRAIGKINHDLENNFISTLERLLSYTSAKDLRLISNLVKLPSLTELESQQEFSDPLNLYKSHREFQSVLGNKLSYVLYQIIENSEKMLTKSWPYGQGERELTGIAWKWLAASGDKYILKKILSYINSQSMTIVRAVLEALKDVDCEERDIAMKEYYESWKDNPILLDSWFRLQASIPGGDALSKIHQLTKHPLFDPLSPNTIRAILGGLASNTTVFHAKDGSGYDFMAKQILSLDRINPITASRIAKVFINWKRYVPINRDAMIKSIISIYNMQLSPNTREVIDLIKGPEL